MFGLMRGQNNPKKALLDELIPDVTILTGDLTDLSSLMRAMNTAQPDEFYNLGAISFVAYSWENAHPHEQVWAWSCSMRSRPCAFTRARAASGYFYRTSSSEMFGQVQAVPQNEDTLLWPRSPVRCGKVYGHLHDDPQLPRKSYGMHVIRVLFRHRSPRRGPEFVTRKVSQAVARIHLGLQDSILWATSTLAATGASPETTSKRCG